ncbi:MAG: hypothetical protein KA383_08150 [Phycisphaerae bacterium]|nr:hypothetical protein [Phycisphaerae bacterium]
MTTHEVPPTQTFDSTATSLGSRVAAERRFETRRPVLCDLWMIDHHGSTVLRCRCIEVSKNGMRLRVPLGYGVAEGQRYELRSHLPGAPSQTSLGLVGSRWATVVRTQLLLGEHEDYLDVGVVLDHSDALLPRMVS